MLSLVISTTWSFFNENGMVLNHIRLRRAPKNHNEDASVDDLGGMTAEQKCASL